ncbi:MAG: hypothetical protein KF832_31720 [Caldilineaceae bacterium]|nr:hypothetical protein [Caldilineaceae bacterium]
MLQHQRSPLSIAPRFIAPRFIAPRFIVNEPAPLPMLPPSTPSSPLVSPQAPIAAPLIYVQKPVRWEYQQLVRNLAKEATLTAAELDMLGKDGWELAGVTTDSPFVYFYFKRVML